MSRLFRLPVTLLCSLLIALLLTPAAHAFPELVAHGYPNCTACHVSPTGGGVATEYGRALSKDLLSTWGREGEEKAFYLLPANETIAIGGDLRGLYLKTKSATTETERTFWMQKDFEVAVTIKKFTVDATLGTHDPRRQNENEFISRRHYLIYQVTDTVSVRAGRFYPQFGIYVPDHYTYIRRDLGWDQNMESYNLEGAWQTENWNVFATAILGRPEDKTLNREAGGTVSVAYSPSEKSKYGASYLYTENDSVTHHYFGPYVILGLTKKLHLLSQLTMVRTFAYTAPEAVMGMVDYVRLGYELFRGVVPFVTQEFSQLNLNTNATRSDAFGAGLMWFPRPHFHFQIQHQNIHSQGLQGHPVERTMVLGHFYP